MRIAFIADGRSENFRRMLSFFDKSSDEILVLSTYPCDEERLVGHLEVLPSLLTAGDFLVKRSDEKNRSEYATEGISRRYRFGKMIYPIWQNVKLVNVISQAVKARWALTKFKPDIVLAFRTQNEGYIAALTGYYPWVLFAQGSDFNYFAHSFPLHRAFTRFILPRVDGLIADCKRDIRLAKELGFPADSPVHLMPGNGGVALDIYRPGLSATERERIIVYPRGIAPYLRLDTLLAAIDVVLKQSSEEKTRFILLSQSVLIAQVEAEIAKYRFPEGAVSVLPFLSQSELASLLRRLTAIVSPSLTDGTPNSMLEAMACGAFPIMSDLESVREWITHGENGLIFDPSDSKELAICIMEALSNVSMCHEAQTTNVEIIQERADYTRTMPGMRSFLEKLIQIQRKQL